MNLADLKSGDIRKIQSIDSQSSYLLELGFIPGEHIEVLSKSPFKGPISYKIKGTTIALRHEEAKHIKC